MLIRLGILLGIFAILGGTLKVLYDNGTLEKFLSTTSIPFEFFRTDTYLEVQDLVVRSEGSRDSKSLKEDLAPLTSTFNHDHKYRPDLPDSILSEGTISELNKILDPIYGVENQFIGKATVSGLIQDKRGWNPLVTFAVYNDSARVRNLTYQFYKTDSGKWSIGELISETIESYAYSELPDQVDLSPVDTITTLDAKFYENKAWENSVVEISPELLKTFRGNYPNVKSRVVYIFSQASVKVTHSFGTPRDILRVVREQSLDKASSTDFTLSLN